MPFLVILGAVFAFVILGWVLVTIWVWERIERAAVEASAAREETRLAQPGYGLDLSGPA